MYRSKCLLVLLTGLLSLVSPGQGALRARYDNYRMYKVNAESEAQLAVLKQLESSSDSIIFLDGVHRLNTDVHMVVAPHKVPDLLEILGREEIKYFLECGDWQKTIDEAWNHVPVKSRSAVYSWKEYHSLNDTYSWLQTLAQQHPGVVTLIDVGQTYEKRRILGVKISKSGAPKPGIFIEAGIHAREWIGPAAATFIINQLVSSEVESIKELAQNYDWYIVPHTNPDGYVYSQTTNRMWRKTRKPYGHFVGADPNRNWDFHWNELDTPNNSDVYPGPSAFSEIETESLSKYIGSIKDRINLYISLHAYSQLLLYPYGYTNELPDNAADYKKVFDAAIGAISKRYGTNYTGGNIYKEIYPAAGASLDWVYGTQGVRMAFCYELRPTGGNDLKSFLLPPDQIIPTSEELLDSITAMVAEVKNLGYFVKKWTTY